MRHADRGEELAANAVRHSRNGRNGCTFTARLLDAPGQYALGEIMDGGSDWGGDLQRSARDASGLQLVLALSAACGVSGERRGRAVWFRVHYPSADTAHTAQPATPGALPLQVPGAQGPPYPAPRCDPHAPGRIAVGPRVLEQGPRGPDAVVRVEAQAPLPPAAVRQPALDASGTVQETAS